MSESSQDAAPQAPDPGPDHAPAPPPVPETPLAGELAFYRANKSTFIDRYEGQWIIVKAGKGYWIRPTYDQALQVGYDSFGLGPFLVKHILAEDPVLRGSAGAYAARDAATKEVERLRADNERLRGNNIALTNDLIVAEQRIADFQAAAMIDIGNDGGPCRVEPHHIESSVTTLRAEVVRLRSELATNQLKTDAVIKEMEDATIAAVAAMRGRLEMLAGLCVYRASIGGEIAGFNEAFRVGSPIQMGWIFKTESEAIEHILGVVNGRTP